MGKPLRVLIVEDSDDDAELLRAELGRAGYDLSCGRVQTAAEMRAALESSSWDLVLSDFSMPTFSGPAALELLKASGLDIPFIIVSGTIGEETAVSPASRRPSSASFATSKPGGFSRDFRSSCASRRRWKPSGSSRAASRTTSTTC
jgi:DNA-binding NtrC family response regulator